jgi:hypothetical protein
VVARLPGVQDVALFGRGLACGRERGGDDPPAVEAAFARAGADSDRSGSMAVTPTLEDVFVSLIEAHDRTHKPPGGTMNLAGSGPWPARRRCTSAATRAASVSRSASRW